MDSRTNASVAIKKILSAFVNARMARHVLREIRLLRHLRHPHIVQLLDIDIPAQYAAWDSVYIVTPLLSTDLRSALVSGKVEDPFTQKRIAFQLVLALDHMHEVGVMHRDIKSRNLLLDENFDVQLCDLGEARFYSKANRDAEEEEQPGLGNAEPQLSGAITTVIQVAPELSLGADYNAEVDIWAAGCVIAEVVHPDHDFVFNNTSLDTHIQEIVDVVGYPDDDMVDILPPHGVRRLRRHRKSSSSKHRIGEFLGENPEPLVVDLLEKMLCLSPKDRLSANEALEHAWFVDVRNEAQVAKEDYNFALSEPPRKTSKAELKNMVWQEVVTFHPEVASLGVH